MNNLSSQLNIRFFHSNEANGGSSTPKPALGGAYVTTGAPSPRQGGSYVSTSSPRTVRPGSYVGTAKTSGPAGCHASAIQHIQHIQRLRSGASM